MLDSRAVSPAGEVGASGRVSWLERVEALPAPVLCFLVGLVLAVASFLFFAPPLFLPIYWDGRINDMMKLAEHPLRRDLYEPILSYRLTMPVITHVLGLRGLWILSVQYLANIGFLGTTFAVLRQRMPPRLAFLGAALVAFSQAGMIGNMSLGLQDPIAHLCTVLLLLTTHPFTVIAVFAGLLADERLMMGVPFVLLWHWIGTDASVGRQWRPALRSAAAIAVGTVAALIVRRLLTSGVIGPGIVLPWAYQYIGSRISSVTGPMREHPAVLAGAVFFAFRWLWLLPVMLFLNAIESRVRRLVALTVVALGIGVLLLSWGGDYTRSIAFMFPAFLWMLPELTKRLARPRRVLLIFFVALALTPQVTSDIGRVGWVRPFPLVALRMATGKDPGTLLKAMFHR